MIDRQIDRVFFVGIGGIGMSALAGYFLHTGYQVAGYDRTDSDICQMLTKKGAEISFTDSPEIFDGEWKNSAKVLVIFTPAIKQSPLMDYFRANEYAIYKRAQILGKIFNQYQGLAVSGTHGKTTTSAILSHILYVAKFKMAAFVGGVLKNYDTNFIINAIPEWIVAEADEFDRSFLQLQPVHAVITAVDADHLDIYENEQNFKQAFVDFAKVVNGKIFVSNTLDKALFAHNQIYSYGIEGDADFLATNIHFDKNGYLFDIQLPDGIVWKSVKLGIFGLINVKNALAATALALQAGATEHDIREALESFKGIRRRFDIWFDNGVTALVDDYAHHPEEILALYKGLRHLYKERKLVAIFQPHLYSRTKDFASEFAAILSNFDQQILLPLYPARELPIPGIDSTLILENISSNNKSIKTKPEMLDYLITCDKNAVFVSIGAGDIDRELPTWNKLLNNKAL